MFTLYLHINCFKLLMTFSLTSVCTSDIVFRRTLSHFGGIKSSKTETFTFLFCIYMIDILLTDYQLSGGVYIYVISANHV